MSETEARIQQEIVRDYNNNYCLVHHVPRCLILSIPNGGDRSDGEKTKAKATGEYAGASDLIVIHYGKVLFVEVKTPTGIQKKSQKGFQKHVVSAGHPYYIVRSLTDFQLLIATYEQPQQK